jgi:microcystin-dependent protein
MADPTTSNVLLAVPTRGSDPGTWDTPMNNNSLELDGFLGGVVSISVSNTPITLTAPAGAVTPGAGPFQSTNRILKFTGALTSGVQITLPLPGEYTIQNLTTGNFVLSFVAAGAGKVVATPQGSVMKIWSDGTDVWLVKNAIPGELKFLGGVTAVPAWITACTVPPFLLNDGTVYSIATFPALGALYGASFGGNGSTTFGVQDLRGRVPLAYDGTGTRITAAGSGINGQVLGSAADNQSVTLNANQIPSITSSGFNNITIGTGATTVLINGTNGQVINTPGGGFNIPAIVNGSFQSVSFVTTNFISVASNNTGGALHTNVQPSMVSGIWLVAT